MQQVRLPAFRGLCLQAEIALNQFRQADIRVWLSATLYDPIASAVPKRQAEYAAGRYLVALSLAELNKVQNSEPNMKQDLEKVLDAEPAGSHACVAGWYPWFNQPQWRQFDLCAK